MDKTSFYILLTTCIFLILSFTLNLYLRQGLFINGVTFIYRFQQLIPHPSMIFLQNLLSYLSDTPFLVLSTFTIYFISKRKISVLVFLTFFILNIYLNAVEKILFMDPRPYMYSLKVKQLQWVCPYEFGNPSGHSRMVFQFYSFLAFDVLGRGRKGVWRMVLPVLMGVLVPLSRLYLGAHSSNQVILGLLLGIGWQVIYRYYLMKKLYDLFNYLIANKNTTHLILIFVINILLLAIPLVIYQYHLPDPFPQQYLNNLSKQCPKLHSIPTATHVMEKNFLSTTIINVVFGILIGVWTTGDQAYRYLYGQWRYYQPRSWIKNRLMRVSIELVPAILAMVVLFGLAPKWMRNDYVRFGVRALGAWVAGFLLVVWTSDLLNRCRVIYETRQGEGVVREQFDGCGCK